MSSLASRLDRIRESFAERAPAEAREIMQRHTQELRDSGVMEQLPRPGDRLAPFSLTDTDGAVVTSDQLLDAGPVIVTFYRGVW